MARPYRLVRGGGVTGLAADSTEDERMSRLSAIGLMSGTSYDGVDLPCSIPMARISGGSADRLPAV
jgi:hypothetical protein